MNEKLFDYIAVCPTAFHTCAHSADMLRESGYTELCEAQRWEIVSGGKYFVTRNGSSLIAFRVPAGKIAGLAKPGQICVKFGRIKHGLLLQKRRVQRGFFENKKIIARSAGSFTLFLTDRKKPGLAMAEEKR